jgi:hypothetical protein
MQLDQLKRRDFITLLGGAAATWPLAARAQQQPERMRRIGVLMNMPADNPEGQQRAKAFETGFRTRLDPRSQPRDRLPMGSPRHQSADSGVRASCRAT